MGLSDSIFILEGSILNTFAPRLLTTFWNLVTFTEGWWKFACCLVSKWYISEFTGSWFLFLIINERREKMYCEGSGRIFRLRNNSLHDSVFLQPIIILIIFFCNLKIFVLSLLTGSRNSKSFSNYLLLHMVWLTS